MATGTPIKLVTELQSVDVDALEDVTATLEVAEVLVDTCETLLSHLRDGFRAFGTDPKAVREFFMMDVILYEVLEKVRGSKKKVGDVVDEVVAARKPKAA